MRVHVLWLLLLAAGCTAAMPDLPAPTGGEVTVFVPGYQGSFLREGDGDLAWLTVGELISSGDRSLALPFDGERPARTYGPLAPEGPLTRFTVLPLIARRDIYLGWMEFGRDALPGFVAFSYDWRKDVRDSGARLCALLDQLAAQHGPSLRVNLVAHSMGGLVALQCLRQSSPGARSVRRAVFVGTPFRGAADIFKDLQQGTGIGRNQALLSREALFTFAAAFQLLPGESDFFVDAADKPVALDAFAPATWLARGWGVFADPAVREDPAYVAQLDRMLAAHAAVAQDARPLPAFAALAVVGRGRQTVSGVRVRGDGFDFERPPRADGDGSVPLASALPPFAFERFDSRAEHTALLNDDAVRQAIVKFFAHR